jgi:hypothetical protein
MMAFFAPLLTLAAAATDGTPDTGPQIAYAPVLDAEATAPAPTPTIAPAPLPLDHAPTQRAIAPLGEANALSDDGLRIGKVDVLKGGKLLLTNGVATVEGS